MTTPKTQKTSDSATTTKPSPLGKVMGFFVRSKPTPEKRLDEKIPAPAAVTSVEASQTIGTTIQPPSEKPEPAKPANIPTSTPEAAVITSVIESSKSLQPASTPAPLNHVVKFTNVSKIFGQGESAQVAVKDVSFVIEDLPDKGELISIVGPSGCGKSTVLRMIAGLEPHYPQSHGTIEILGRSGALLPSAERGLVDQKYSLFPHLTVRQNIMFGLDIRGESRSTRGDKADIWIKRVGLEGSANKYPQELSGGMQQRVAIASTLVLGPRILLMDEPFGALDPKIRLQMQELLVQLWNEQQSTVFIVTHSIEEALYLGDRVFRMASRPGRLVEILQAPRPEMPPEEMRQKKWFVEMTRDLLNRLEQDKTACGELAYYSDYVTDGKSRLVKGQP